MIDSLLPATSDDITVAWLNDVLGETGVFQDTTVRSFERQVIGEGVGFVGELSRLTLTYEIGRASCRERV